MDRIRRSSVCSILLLCVLSLCLASAQGKIKLKYSHWGNEDEKASTAATLQAFMRANPGIAVEQMYIPESGDPYMQKMSAMAASATLPDAALFPDQYALNWGLKGLLIDLSDIFSGVHEKVDAIQYRLPSGKLVAVAGAQEIMLLWYSKDIFNSEEMDFPPSAASQAWTWDQFVAIAKRLTKDTNGKTALDPAFDPSKIDRYGAQIPTWDMPLLTFMQSNGGNLFSDDWKTLTLDTRENAEALQAIADLMNKHHAAPRPTTSMASVSNALLTEKVAMVMEGQWSLETLNRVRKSDGLNFGIGVLPYFKKPLTTAIGGPIVAFAASKHPVEAKKLVSFIMDPANTPDYIKGGLWMPNEKRWYKNADLMAAWIGNENHPPEYRTAVLEYSLTNIGKPLPLYRVPNYAALWNIIGPALDNVWLGKTTAASALSGIAPQARAYFNKEILPLLK